MTIAYMVSNAKQMNNMIPTILGSIGVTHFANKYKTRYITAITKSIINRLSKIFSSMAIDLEK